MDTTKFNEWAISEHSAALKAALTEREELAAKVTELTYDRINSFSVSIAECDGRVEVTSVMIQGALRLLSDEVTEIDLMNHLVRELTRSPMDTSSGRRNDAQRAFVDGRREQLSKVYDQLRYGVSL